MKLLNIFLFIALLQLLSGCEKGTQNDTDAPVSVYECWGGLSAQLEFSDSMPEKVRAEYTRRFFSSPHEMQEIKDECSVGTELFYRSENTLHVSFLSIGAKAPEIFDLVIVDCESNQELFRVENVQPGPVGEGQGCSGINVNYEVF